MRATLALGGVLLCASSALAAGGGHGGGELHVNWWKWDSHSPPVGWFFVDFLIFVFLLYKLAGKPMKAAFERRHATIKSAIAEIDATHRKAKADHQEYRDKLQRVEQEVSSLIEGTRSDARDEQAAIIKAAQTYAERLRGDSKTIVGFEVERARQRLHQEVVRAALDRAQRTLETALTDDDRQRLFDKAVADLENGHAGGHARSPSSVGAQSIAGGAP